MDVASDRVSCTHVSTLRHVKDMREQRALSEWQSLEATHRAALEAEETARVQLASTQGERARLESELYRQLVLSEPLSTADLDRCQLVLERLASEVVARQQQLDEASGVREKAAAAASEGRARWVKSSAATHKWGQIEASVLRAAQTRAESATEIEAEDDVSLRYGRGAGARALGGSV